MNTIETQKKDAAINEDWFTEYFEQRELPVLKWYPVLEAIQGLRPVDQNKVRRHLDNIKDPVPYLEYLELGLKPEGGLVI